MSGVVSGITKVFSAVGSATARVGQAVAGVGASVFTAGAATGAGSLASGGLTGAIQSVAGKGVLSNVLSGAIKMAVPGAIIGAVTGQGAMKGALMGGLGGAVMGGMGGMDGISSMLGGNGSDALAGGAGADTLSSGGMGRAGGVGHPDAGGGFSSTSVPQINPGTGEAVAATTGATSSIPGGTAAGELAKSNNGGFMGKIGNFLNSETGAGVLSGLGQGMIEKAKVDAIAAENQKNRDFQLANQKRITDSYNVNTSRWTYDPAAGRVVMS
jgi:hypothetical protein